MQAKEVKLSRDFQRFFKVVGPVWTHSDLFGCMSEFVHSFVRLFVSLPGGLPGGTGMVTQPPRHGGGGGREY